MQISSNTDEILTVSALNRKARSLLETQLNQIRVEGEISNFSRPASGHWYFTLKDSNAQIRCAMFRNRNALLKRQPSAGDKVIVRARVSLYEARGDYQLIAEHMAPAGEGMLQKTFEELKQKLLLEGLFEQGYKRPLPSFPQTIAVISSASGAAIHDIQHVFERRNPAIEVHVIPSLVQGVDAPKALIRALRLAESNNYDAIIIGRGGGSLEDLWAFNDEALARAIFACKTPIVSAVGHEVDFSISDFVADQRAPTPSAAAELLSPTRDNMLLQLRSLEARLGDSLLQRTNQQRHRLLQLTQKLKHPGDKIQQWQQRSDFCEQRLKSRIRAILQTAAQRSSNLNQRMATINPGTKIELQKTYIARQAQQLMFAMNTVNQRKRRDFEQAATNLDLVSPLATMQRGYTITKNSSGNILRSIHDCSPGEEVAIHFHDGSVEAEIRNR